MEGIYAAVTRRTIDGKNPDGWVPQQKIKVEEALRAYTIDAAYAGFSEKSLGSIEPGKLADMVILGRNLFDTPPNELNAVPIRKTIVGGKVVYDNDLKKMLNVRNNVAEYQDQRVSQHRLLGHSYAAMRLLFAIFTLSSSQRCAHRAPMLQWHAGVAKVNISPELPIWLSGYGGRNKPAATKHDDLWAKALVIEDAAGHRAVLVTLDLVGIPRELSLNVCKQIEKRYKLPRAAIALCSSHTHSGPVVRGNLMAMYSLDEDQSRDESTNTKRSWPRSWSMSSATHQNAQAGKVIVGNRRSGLCDQSPQQSGRQSQAS